MKTFRPSLHILERPLPVLTVIAVFYLFGIFFHLLPSTSTYMALLTPYVLFVVGAVVLYPVVREGHRNILVWAALTYLVTFTLEAVGVATGMVFGAYDYGEVLGAKIFEVPPVIGFNWVLVLLGCVRTTEKITSSPLWAGLLTGIAAVIFDVVLEPVAISLEYWNWHGGTIPMQNYAAWFFIAAVAGWAYRRAGMSLKSVIPGWYVLIQLGFFAGLRITGAV